MKEGAVRLLFYQGKEKRMNLLRKLFSREREEAAPFAQR